MASESKQAQCSAVFKTETVEEFVKRVCRGRDESHGYEHMKQVRDTALSICSDLDLSLNPYLAEWCSVVAWLHDVADHKYDKDGTLRKQVEDFLRHMYGSRMASWYQDIIDRISYSREVNDQKTGMYLTWGIVLGPLGTIVRDIVSDADKLDALGEQGYRRCREYTIERLKKSDAYKNGKLIPDAVIQAHIQQHAEEKLFRLKDEFIRTESGKSRAQLLHDQLKKMVIS